MQIYSRIELKGIIEIVESVYEILIRLQIGNVTDKFSSF